MAKTRVDKIIWGGKIITLFDYKDWIVGKPIHITTVNSSNGSNLSVVFDIRVTK